MGNTVLVVEHDADTIERADYVIDLGPGAGTTRRRTRSLRHPRRNSREPQLAYRPIPRRHLSKSPFPKNAVRATARSITRYRRARTQPQRRRPSKFHVGRPHRHHRRLRQRQIYAHQRHRLPHARQRESTAPAKMPGAHDTFTGIENIDKVVRIDQSAIGRTPRSNPATYTGLFAPHPRSFRSASRIPRTRLQAGPLQLQRKRRALRSVSRRWPESASK